MGDDDLLDGPLDAEPRAFARLEQAVLDAEAPDEPACLIGAHKPDPVAEALPHDSASRRSHLRRSRLPSP
jgi:hypothetical protein